MERIDGPLEGPIEITQREASDRLRAPGAHVRLLMDAGLVPVLHHGRREFCDAEEVNYLASWRDIDHEHPAAFVVRATRPLSSRGTYRGWAHLNYPGADLSLRAENRREAVRGWYPVADPSALVGSPLVVTVASFVVAVYRITGSEGRYMGSSGAVTGFHIEPVAIDSDLARPFVGRRIQLGPGNAGLHMTAGAPVRRTDPLTREEEEAAA